MLRRARIGQRAAQHAGSLAGHEARVGDAVAAAVSQAVVGLRIRRRRHGERGAGDRSRRREARRQVVVEQVGPAEGQAVDRHRLAGAGVRRPEGARRARDRQHVPGDQAREDGGRDVRGTHGRPGQSVVHLVLRRHARDPGDRAAGDVADASDNGGAGDAIAVDGLSGGTGGREVRRIEPVDGDVLGGAGHLVIVVSGSGHRGSESDHISVDPAADGVIGPEEIGGGVVAVVDLGDGAGEAEADLGLIGIEKPVARAGRQGDSVGRAILLIIVRDVAVLVARRRIEGRRIGTPHLPCLPRAGGERSGTRVINEISGGDSDVSVYGERLARVDGDLGGSDR